MIDFSSSLKLNEIHRVDSPFNKSAKNIIFSREALTSGEGRPQYFRKMGNNRDIRDSKMGLLAQTTTFTTFVARQRSR